MIKTEKAIKLSFEELELHKAIYRCEIIVLCLFLVLDISSVFIFGANNYSMYLTGVGHTLQTITLSSTLLFIPVVAPFPNRKYGIALLVIAIVSLAIPYFLLGKQCYSILPELVLRVAIAIAYAVVYINIEKTLN